MFFGWHGPWQLFNGLIVWFIAPEGNPQGRLSGLFDYANIAGAWLAIVWPFSLAFLLKRSSSFRIGLFSLLLNISIVCALALTDSRNAWGGFVLAIPFVIGPSRWIWLLPLMGIFLAPMVFAVFPEMNPQIQTLARKIVPEDIWSRLSDVKYMDTRTVASTRLNQWKVAIQIVLEKPILGWGAAAFSIIYPLNSGLWHGHAHNLPLELAVSSGLPASILIVSLVIGLLVTTLKRGIFLSYSKKFRTHSFQIFDRAWWAAALTLVFLHGADMPLFDSRLNIAGWILLSGLRCLISQPQLTR